MIEQINKFVSSGDHDYDNLLHHLRRYGELGVWMPRIGTAYLVDEGKADGDQNFFVFKVKSWDGERFFRKTGWYNSFGDGGYDGGLTEVKPMEVQKTDWVEA